MNYQHHQEIGVCAETLASMPRSDARPADEAQAPPWNRSSDCHCGDLLLDRGDFQIRIADRRLMTASELLVDRMYSWRGYKFDRQHGQAPETDEITLQACQGTTVFGTLTIRFDSKFGLAADVLYRDEIDTHRQAKAKVAELTRLAIDPELGSKELLGALFHLAYVCVGPVRHVDGVFIEVHPRHVPFYRRMLDFRRVGECKMSPRVEAPAVLLYVEVAHVGEQAARYGGRRAVANRSLYPYFCSAQEEAGAIQHIFELVRQAGVDVARAGAYQSALTGSAREAYRTARSLGLRPTAQPLTQANVPRYRSP